MRSSPPAERKPGGGRNAFADALRAESRQSIEVSRDRSTGEARAKREETASGTTHPEPTAAEKDASSADSIDARSDTDELPATDGHNEPLAAVAPSTPTDVPVEPVPVSAILLSPSAELPPVPLEIEPELQGEASRPTVRDGAGSPVQVTKSDLQLQTPPQPMLDRQRAEPIADAVRSAAQQPSGASSPSGTTATAEGVPAAINLPEPSAPKRNPRAAASSPTHGSSENPRGLSAPAAESEETNPPSAPSSAKVPSVAVQPAEETPAHMRAQQLDDEVRVDRAAQLPPVRADSTPSPTLGVEQSRTLPADSKSIASMTSPPTAWTAAAGETPESAQPVVRGLTALAGQHGGSLTMRLDPPDLGELRIDLRIVRGVVTADFRVGDGPARDLLERSLPMLRHALEQQGLSVEKLEVHAPSYPATPASAADLRREGGDASSDRQQTPDQRSNAGQGESRGRGDGQGRQDRAFDDRRSARPRFDLKEFLETTATRGDAA